jgi:hypothetical protein
MASPRWRQGRLVQTTKFNILCIRHQNGLDKTAVEAAHAEYQKAIGSESQWTAESALRAALRRLDTSPQGMRQSYGMMVNYLYEPDAIEINVEAFTLQGVVAASTAVRRAGRD